MTALRQRKSSKVKEVSLDTQSQRCEHAAGNLNKSVFGQYHFVSWTFYHFEMVHIVLNIYVSIFLFSEGTSWWTVLCIIFGSIVGVSLGLLCCIYVATLHENDLWFSNIKVSFQCNVSILFQNKAAARLVFVQSTSWKITLI